MAAVAVSILPEYEASLPFASMCHTLLHLYKAGKQLTNIFYFQFTYQFFQMSKILIENYLNQQEFHLFLMVFYINKKQLSRYEKIGY